MNKQIDQLYNFSEQAIVLSKKRGFNYALQTWHSMFTHWCDQSKVSPDRVPVEVIQELKKRSMLFCDYFN